jgi:hypothetical protein
MLHDPSFAIFMGVIFALTVFTAFFSFRVSSFVTGGAGILASSAVGAWVSEGSPWWQVWTAAAAGCALTLVVFLAGFRPRDEARRDATRE